jgi:putative ABC transport system permease protein
MLAKAPGFTSIALLTLMLGIGATAAIFSVTDAVLLRSLPFRDPDRLVSVFEDESELGFPRNTPAPGNYAEWRKQTQIFTSVAAMAVGNCNLTGSTGEPEKLNRIETTQNLFSLLGVRPILGRVFLPEEDKPGAHRVALLSYRLWTGRFGSNRQLIGQNIVLDGSKYTVIGVMPPHFEFPEKEADVWIPIALTAKQLAERDSHYLHVVGKLQPGVTVAKANSDLAVLWRQLKRAYPRTDESTLRFFVEPLQDTYTRDVHRGLLVLMAAVCFILLIACANVANLLLSRASSRSREIAVRTALGAGKPRIVRQLLTENTLLALGGGALGLILANWCFAFLKNLIPPDLAPSVSLRMNFPVLGFAVAMILLSSFLFGLAPALQAARVDLNDVLKEGSRGSTGPRRRLFRNVLVVGEVSLSLTLLIGAGLLLESFINLRGVNTGFESDHVLTMQLVIANTNLSDNVTSPDAGSRTFIKRSQFFEQLLGRVRSLPGVENAGVTSAIPLTWPGGTNSFTPEGVRLDPKRTYDANDRVVTPGYFESMRIPLKKGRLFNERDGKDAPLVAIINQTMARNFWPNQDVIGKRFKFGSPEEKTPWVRIIGVVGDVRQMALNQPARQEMYFPYWQAKDNWMVPRDLVIRTAGDPMQLAGAVRRAVWSINPDQPVSNVMTLDDLLDQEVTQPRIQAVLLGGLAVLALILACIGIYGVLSYLVSQRTKEIGVRVALGAKAVDVFRATASEGLALAGIGMLAGIAGSLALSSALTGLLFGVKSIDPATYLMALVIFAAVAFAACCIPAWRAARVDPMVALRYE